MRIEFYIDGGKWGKIWYLFCHLPSAWEVMLSCTGHMSETCSKSLRSLLIVLANTSSLRALWNGSSIIMPALAWRDDTVCLVQCGTIIRQVSWLRLVQGKWVSSRMAEWEWECVCCTYFLYSEQGPGDDSNEGHHIWSCIWYENIPSVHGPMSGFHINPTVMMIAYLIPRPRR